MFRNVDFHNQLMKASKQVYMESVLYKERSVIKTVRYFEIWMYNNDLPAAILFIVDVGDDGMFTEWQLVFSLCLVIVCGLHSYLTRNITHLNSFLIDEIVFVGKCFGVVAKKKSKNR